MVNAPRPLWQPSWISKHFGRKCPICKVRGYSDFIDSVILGRTQGSETVVRKTQIKDSEGEVVRTIEREVDIPVVHVKSKRNYHCYNCGKDWYAIKTATHEGVMPKTPRSVVISKEVMTREIVKVPCRYCGTLNVLPTDKFCSGCGAPVK